MLQIGTYTVKPIIFNKAYNIFSIISLYAVLRLQKFATDIIYKFQHVICRSSEITEEKYCNKKMKIKKMLRRLEGG